jgi:AcrR family transcriptional regulator
MSSSSGRCGQTTAPVLDLDGYLSLEGDVAGAKNHPVNKLSTATVILDAAEQLCGTHGIEAVSIRDIAAAADVSIAVIYHHYKSKANLLRSILHTRFAEIKEEHERLLTELEAQKSPAVKDIARAVLQPINQWRRPDREAALQFYALALVCPLPELKNAIDAGVVGLQRVVALLQRALPGLTHEDICWRLHFTMKITHLTQWDAARLAIMSKGDCRDDPEESLARGMAFAEAAFLAPPIAYPTKLANQVGARKRRPPK